MVLDARPGMHVLDMCAAPGGKTCAIADCMANDGTIIAFDRTEEKITLVRQMAEQYGHSTCIRASRKDATGILQLSDQVKAKHAAVRTCCIPALLAIVQLLLSPLPLSRPLPPAASQDCLPQPA